jgi:hypothetical protein
MNLIRRIILALALMAGIAPVMAQAPSPVPALPDTERRTTYSITGTTCACAVNFALYGDSTDYGNWIEVWLNGTLIPSTNYTITSPSGSLATLPRPITNAVMTFNSVQTGTVQIVGARRPRRTSQFAENRGVAARDLNQAVTDIVAMLRENWDKTNDVTGRAVLAPPGETLAVLASAASRASSGACFDAGGNLVSCVSIPSTTFTAGNGIAITGVSPKTITSNIQGSGPITITGTNPLIVGCATCNTSPAAATSAVFVASRAAASSLDLHTYSVVRTGGYAAGGDGGGATFKNVSSAAFLDSSIVTGTLTAGGSAYTNGTYLSVPLTGGTGTNAVASITVAGGAVTTVTIRITGGNGYSVGDVLSAAAANIGGTGSGFTWTVSTISTPTGSFTDSAGTHWQITPDEGNFANVRQFGAKIDYAGTDGSATNDYTAIQNAYNFCAFIHSPTVDGGGSAGCKVMHPPGTSLVCGSVPLLIPQGVSVEGANIWASTLKMCSTWADAQHFVVLCDPNTHASCFGSRLHNITLYSPFTQTANSSIAMVYSNSIQQIDVFDRVAIYSGRRNCINLEIGYGGAALLGMQNVECNPGSGGINSGIKINYGTTLVTMRNVHVETGGPLNILGLEIDGGFVNLTGFHTEGITNGIVANIQTNNANGIVSARLLSGGVNCTNLVLKQTGSAANSVIVGQAVTNGCTNSVNNGGSLTVTNIVGDTVY